MSPPSAESIRAELEALADDAQRAKIEKRLPDAETAVIGVRMGMVFDIAKGHVDLPLSEVERLIDSGIYELKMVGVSILDFPARQRRITDAGRALFVLARSDVWWHRRTAITAAG